MRAKTVSQSFKVIFKLEIFMFLSFMVSFLVDLSNQKTSFLMALLCKVVHNAKLHCCTDKANGGVPLIVENV